MNITPEPRNNAPKYPQAGADDSKKRRIRDFIISGAAIPLHDPVEVLILMNEEERQMAEDLLSHGKAGLSARILGGTPMETGSPEAAEQQRRLRIFRKICRQLKRCGIDIPR